MRKFLLVILLFLFKGHVFAENFTITRSRVKTQRSKTRIKEDIGLNIKDALNNCAEINKQIGQIQIELSTLQKTLFAKVEELIDNKKPFKTAKRSDLLKTLNTIKEVNLSFANQLKVVENLKNKMNSDICLKHIRT